MTKLTIIAFLFSIIFYSNLSFSLELTVKVAKVKTFNKNIVLELYSLADKKTQLWQQAQLTNTKIFELTPESQEIKISSLQVGTYAIRLFQDTNSNGILERTASDIPLEPVGFSQNPSLFGGEPTPEDSAFILSNNQSITISLKHRKPKKKRKNE